MRLSTFSLFLALLLSLGPTRGHASPQVPVRSVSDLLERAKEIRFDSGGAIILGSSDPFLDALAGQLRIETDARLEIGSHVPDSGDPKKDQALSQRRAEAVKSALVARGVPGNRLEAKGYGATQPVAPSLTRTGKMRNNRIELHRVAR